MVAQDFEAGIRRPAAAARLAARVVDEKEPLRILDRERLHQHRVDQAEDGGIGANPESQGQNRHRGQCRRPAEETQRVAHVSAELVDQAQAQHLAAFLFARLDAAEFRPRPPPGFLVREPAASQVGFIQLDMRLQFVVHPALETGTAHTGTKP